MKGMLMMLRATLCVPLLTTHALGAPPRAEAQSPLTVALSPLAGVGDFRGQYRLVPSELSGSGSVSLDANVVLGIQAEVARRGLPLRLRVGAARTTDGFLRVQTGYRTESCGARCSRTEVVYGSAGGAAIAMLWTDAVLVPFSRKVSPYVFGGVAYRRTSFSPSTSEIAAYFPSEESKSLVRFGVGAELRALGHVMWIDMARHAADSWLVSDRSSLNPPQRQALVSLGMKLHIR